VIRPVDIQAPEIQARTRPRMNPVPRRRVQHDVATLHGREEILANLEIPLEIRMRRLERSEIVQNQLVPPGKQLSHTLANIAGRAGDQDFHA